MRNTLIVRNNPPTLLIAITLLVLVTASCRATGSIASEAGGETDTPAPLATETQAPSPTATPEPTLTDTPQPTPTGTPEPSPTATPAPQPLEIVEWAEYPYANLADPQNTDTRLEILVRNPNEFPVQVNLDGVELRLVNAAGETVYMNPNPTFYIWEGSWVLGGETVPLSACACFNSSGMEKQAWEALELAAPLEAAPDIAYTNDVEVTLGEFFSLEEAHLGGDQLGAEITLVNTSDQVLKSFEVRVTARDASGKYVGVVIYGSFNHRDSSGNYVNIDPGATGGGVIVSLIDYVDEPLNHEVTALGIPADR